MRPASDPDAFVGVNWGSSNFRAFLIAPDGTLIDDIALAAGVTALDRKGMIRTMASVGEAWGAGRRVYASGMIGSPVGWVEVPYIEAPASLADIANALKPATIGQVDVMLVPGVACMRVFDGAPDVLRGEEIELFGLAALRPGLSGTVALPGTHTKWANFEDGRMVDFATSMSGEIFDRLTSAGLLSSIVDGPANDGAAFLAGIDDSKPSSLGLATLLFGARARVVRGLMPKSDAASFIRGLLIGSELSDVALLQAGRPASTIPLVGNAALCVLYEAAIKHRGGLAERGDVKAAGVAGYTALHALAGAS